MDKKLIFLLVICFSISFLGFSYHRHKDGASHDNCLLCANMLHHFLSVSSDNPQISLLPSKPFSISLENTLSKVYRHYPCYLNRAPPV